MSLQPEAPTVAAVSVSDMRERIRRKSHLKGRQPEDVAMTEVAGLLGPRPATGLRRDLLIEYLHRLNDHFGVLHDRHLVALAKQMNLPMAEVYEVASFYHHFEIVRGEEAQAPRLVLRVCDSLSCSMAGARELLDALPARLQAAGQGDVQVLAVPCVGRCEQAPVAVVHQCPVPQATLDSVLETVTLKPNRALAPSIHQRRLLSILMFPTSPRQASLRNQKASAPRTLISPPTAPAAVTRPLPPWSTARWTPRGCWLPWRIRACAAWAARASRRGASGGLFGTSPRHA